ncbi:MAG: hypothetical protein QOI71_3879, partial [Gaiellales bacterium]|nr:hypothetical protein [Gaiellales bacterium]
RAEGAAADEVVAAPARSTRRRTARGGAGRSATAEAAVAETEAHAETGDEDDHAGAAGSDETTGGEAPAADEHARAPRKRGRRRGRGRGARGLEARLLPGSVLLLDPSVTADATFQEHWQGGGPLRVEVSADAIVLRRVPGGDADHERSDRSSAG